MANPLKIEIKFKSKSLGITKTKSASDGIKALNSSVRKFERVLSKDAKRWSRIYPRLTSAYKEHQRFLFRYSVDVHGEQFRDLSIRRKGERGLTLNRYAKGKILHDTGSLLNSFELLSKRKLSSKAILSLSFGSTDSAADILSSGGYNDEDKYVPPRHFLGIDPSSSQGKKFLAQVDAAIMESINDIERSI